MLQMLQRPEDAADAASRLGSGLKHRCEVQANCGSSPTAQPAPAASRKRRLHCKFPRIMLNRHAPVATSELSLGLRLFSCRMPTSWQRRRSAGYRQELDVSVDELYDLLHVRFRYYRRLLLLSGVKGTPPFCTEPPAVTDCRIVFGTCSCLQAMLLCRNALKVHGADLTEPQPYDRHRHLVGHP